MAETGAVRLIETLIAEGVETIFSLSGNQIMSVYDATIDRDIELIHTRHEAAAVHMADAVGRLTGQAGVALLPAGPGHCNAISALYVARMAESPVRGERVERGQRAGIDHRRDGARRLLFGGVPAGEGLRGAWRRASCIDRNL